MKNFQFDDDFENDNDFNLENQDDEPFFSPDELSEMMGDQQKIDDARKIYEKITGFLEEKENNIIKAEDIKENVSDFELDQILNYDEEVRKKDFYVPNNESMVVDKTNEELFNDYLKYPKIAGKKNLHDDSTLISQDKLDESTKMIEIKDQEPDIEGHHTTIEIVRDEFEEIESIVVHCKCGEKTVIRFDYDSNDSLENIIDSKTKVSPFSVEEIKLKINNGDD